MYVYIWEYRVRPDCRELFLEHYSPSGTWVTLFRRAHGHVRTDLLEDRGDPLRFVTIDTWESVELHDEFKQQFAREFDELGSRCESLTLSENLFGHFCTASPVLPE